MKALAAMSGGVDSSVTAHLLLQAGYDTAGVNFRLFDGDGCGSERESNDAAKAAKWLGIPFYVYNYTNEFAQEVIARFISVYENGATPNPCVECNKHIKFSKIYEIAEDGGWNKIATGHYANVRYDEGSGRYLLYRGADLSKDQSYVLYGLSQKVLAKATFPLGQLTKVQVREIAASLGLHNAEKKDSQDICFIPDGDYGTFIEGYTGKKWRDGSFVDMTGKVLGEHKGIIRYTIGQRKGLGLALPHPMFVLRKDMKNNTVVLCDGPELYTRTIDACNINLITTDRLSGAIRVEAKARYKQPAQKATVEQTGEDILHIEFDEPVRAAAPGQSVVLYDGDLVIGGGTIL